MDEVGCEGDNRNGGRVWGVMIIAEVGDQGKQGTAGWREVVSVLNIRGSARSLVTMTDKSHA